MKNFTKRGMVSEALPPIIAAIFMGVCIFLYGLGFLLLYYRLASLSQKAKKYWIVPFILLIIGSGTILLPIIWFFIVDFITSLFY